MDVLEILSKGCLLVSFADDEKLCVSGAWARDGSRLPATGSDGGLLAKILLCGVVATLYDGVGSCAPRPMKGFSHGNAGADAGGAAALAAATARAGVAAK